MSSEEAWQLPVLYEYVTMVDCVNAECICAGKLHGYGFVQFQTQEAAEKACQLHGSDFMGRELTVDVATAADGGKAPTGTPVEGCWFCLSNPNADVNLVASIGMFLSYVLSNSRSGEIHLACDQLQWQAFHAVEAVQEPSFAVLRGGPM